MPRQKVMHARAKGHACQGKRSCMPGQKVMHAKTKSHACQGKRSCMPRQKVMHARAKRSCMAGKYLLIPASCHSLKPQPTSGTVCNVFQHLDISVDFRLHHIRMKSPLPETFIQDSPDGIVQHHLHTFHIHFRTEPGQIRMA